MNGKHNWPGDLLQALVERAQLTEDLRSRRLPLYRIPCSPAQLEELASLLRPRLADPDQIRGDDAAAFCLFASRAFCRDYVGGPWRWELVEKALGGALPDQGSLTKLVTRGLRQVGQEIVQLSGRRRFLTTIGFQGGLPLGALRATGSALGDWLKRALERHEAYPSVPLESIAEETATSQVAEGLRQQPVYRLVGELAAGVSRVRAQLPEDLADDQSLIRDLDERSPSWRSHLPLELEDEQARSLLVTLLRLSKAPGERGRKAPLQVLTHLLVAVRADGATAGHSQATAPARPVELLDEGNGTGRESVLTRFEITRSLRVTDFLDEEATRTADGEAVLGRGYEVTLEAGGVARSVGKLRWHSRKGCFQYFPAAEERARLLDQTGKLSVRAEGLEITTEPSGAEAMEDDLPWVFATDGGREWLGQGSLRTSREAVLVAVPAGHSLDVEAGRTRLVGEVREREVHELEGRARVRDRTGDGCRIATRTAEDGVARFRLHGHGCLDVVDAEKTFLERPYLVRVQEGLPSVTYREDQISWTPVDGGVPSSARYGNFRLALREGGDVLFRTRLTILPRSFRPLPTGETTLRLAAPEIAEMISASGGGEVSRGEHGIWTIAFPAHDPTPLRVRLRFTDGGLAEVALLPRTRPYGFEHMGRALADRDAVAVERLGEIRARVAPLDEKMDVWLGLKAGAWEIPLASIVPPKRAELHARNDPLLSFVSEPAEILMGLRDELDDRIELWLSDRHAHRGGDRTMQVHRFAFRLDRETLPDGRSRLRWQETTVTKLPHDRACDVVCEVRRLWDPAEVVECLSGSVEEGWIFDPRGKERGDWLITPRVAQMRPVRPLRIRVERGKAPEGIGMLQRAILAKNFKAAIDARLKEMLECRGDPDWQVLGELLHVASMLGARTLKAAHCVAETQAAAIHVVLNEPDDARRRACARLLAREGLLWEIVAFETWANALEARIEGLPEHLAPTVLKTDIAAVAALHDALDHAAALAGLLAHHFSLVVPGVTPIRPRTDEEYREALGEQLRDSPETPYQQALSRLDRIRGPKRLGITKILRTLGGLADSRFTGNEDNRHVAASAPILLVHTLRKLRAARLPLEWSEEWMVARSASPTTWSEVMARMWEYTLSPGESR